MDAIELLKTRASNGKLVEPAPDEQSLRIALEAAARAPDHGTLRPWRVHLVRGEARARLGDLMAAAQKRKNPNATDDDLDKARKKALRAPLILVVSAIVKPHPKVPELEQIVCAGTAAHAILLALQARGYAAIWKTGAPAYDLELKQAFGLGSQDALVGFIYAGTAAQPAPTMARPAPEAFTQDWKG